MVMVGELRAKGYDVPNVDPNDGGVEARVLFLSETPGPRAVATGYVSQDNPDPSARNKKLALEQAGLLREDTLLWNVVPYCVSTVDQNANATGRQIRDALPYTQALVDLLPSLRVIVFCGRKAEKAMPHIRLPVGAYALSTFHTAARSFNHVRQREHILQTYRRARELADSET